MYETMKTELTKLINELKPIPAEKLIHERIQKFSSMGAFTETASV
jgi:acetyl-CoA carboxylase alpha subunit